MARDVYTSDTPLLLRTNHVLHALPSLKKKESVRPLQEYHQRLLDSISKDDVCSCQEVLKSRVISLLAWLIIQISGSVMMM